MSDSDRLRHLAARTRFSERELRELSAAGDLALDRGGFERMADEAGIGDPQLRDRMWRLLDTDHDGRLSPDERIVALSHLLRGDVDDVAEAFFSLYDLDADRRVEPQEMLEVAERWWTDRNDGPPSTRLRERIAAFVRDADRDHDGRLDRAELRDGLEAELSRTRARRRLTLVAVLGMVALFGLTAWFELGTSFGLPSMGALAPWIKGRLAIDDAAIGQLTGYYYVAAIVGPLVGGALIDRIGPAPVLAGANVLVAAGALLQAVAGDFGTLVAGRIVMGLGGEVTAFATIELLALLFPSRFMLMCGLRNLVQSASGFLAFLVLPWLATERDPDTALWFIVATGIASLASSAVAWVYVRRRASERAAQISPATLLRAFATRLVPRPQGGLAALRLPLSFFVAIFGVKAFYLPLFSFTAFSVEIFTGSKFGLSIEEAGLLSGVISLLAGLSGPLFGPLSDRVGRRATSSAIVMVPAIVAFCLFAFFDGVSPWVGVVLLALTYGYGDTCAFVSIRLLAGPRRAGMGYGVYAVLGNLVAFVVPVAGGWVIEHHGHDALLLYFAALMGVGMLCWLAVRALEGPDSPLERPTRELVRTDDAVVDAAAMHVPVDPDRPPSLQ